MFARPGIPRNGARLLLLILLATLPVSQHAILAASDPCKPPNVLPSSVCDFDDWHGDSPRQVSNGWNEYILSGNPDYYRDEHSFFGGGTQTIRSGEPFLAGIWTQADVTPGAGYRASVAWGAPNLPAEFGRQLGLDPTGGTDPTAPTVIWGPQHFGDGRMLNYITDGPNIDIRARAVGSRMTLFFSVDRPTSSGDGLIFIDAIALYPDESAPGVIDAPTATPVEVPTELPTIAPTQAPPTETPTAIPTETPTELPTAPAVITPMVVMTETIGPEGPSQGFLPITVVQSAPGGPAPQTGASLAAAAAPVPLAAAAASAPQPAPLLPAFTATATLAPTASPTPTPTWTPWPTAAPPKFIDAAGTALRVGNVNGLRSVPSSRLSLALLGTFSIAGVLLFGGSLFWVRRR